MATHSSILAWRIPGTDEPSGLPYMGSHRVGHDWSDLAAAAAGVAKSRTRLSDFTFNFHFHALEKELATHSSVLAWRIPGTGEPGGLPSMGSHRVGRDWSALTAAGGFDTVGSILWVWSPGQEDPLEEGMATHSFLPQRIPWTEGHGGLQSIGMQRVEHDWSNLAHTHAQVFIYLNITLNCMFVSLCLY